MNKRAAYRLPPVRLKLLNKPFEYFRGIPEQPRRIWEISVRAQQSGAPGPQCTFKHTGFECRGYLGKEEQTVSKQLHAPQIEAPMQAVIQQTWNPAAPVFLRFHVSHEVEPNLR